MLIGSELTDLPYVNPLRTPRDIALSCMSDKPMVSSSSSIGAVELSLLEETSSLKNDFFDRFDEPTNASTAELIINFIFYLIIIMNR